MQTVIVNLESKASLAPTSDHEDAPRRMKKLVLHLGRHEATMEAGDSSSGDTMMAVDTEDTSVSDSGASEMDALPADYQLMVDNGDITHEEALIAAGIEPVPNADYSDSVSNSDSDSDLYQPLTESARKNTKPDLTFVGEAEAFANREIRNVKCAATIKAERFKKFRKLAREARKAILEAKEKVRAKSRLLDKAEIEKRCLREEVYRLKEKNSGLQGQVSRLEGEVNSLQGEASGLQGQVSGLQDEVSRLEEENNEHICGSEWRDKYDELLETHYKYKEDVEKAKSAFPK